MNITKPLFTEDAELTDFENMIPDLEAEDGTDEITHIEDDESGFQAFGKFAVNDEWDAKFNSEIRLPHESYEIKMLHDNMYDIFVNSSFYETYAKMKKVPKRDMLKIFLYFYDNLKDKERYTSVEKFLEIADFMNMNYEMLYKELPMLYKQNLIADLDKKYKIFDKRKVRKLF